MGEDVEEAADDAEEGVGGDGEGDQVGFFYCCRRLGVGLFLGVCEGWGLGLRWRLRWGFGEEGELMARLLEVWI